MKCHRLALMIILFGGLCWSIYGLISRDGSYASQSKEFHRADRYILDENEDIDSLKVRMVGLERKVASLLAQLNQAKADFRKDSDILAQVLVSVDRDVHRQGLDDETEFSDPIAALQQVKLQEQQQQATIESSFQNESIDIAWARDSTEAIDVVLDNDGLKNADVIERDCRTTLCRLEVQHEDQNDLASFEIFLSLQVGDRFPELSVIHETGEYGEVSTVVYLAREGYHLPDVEFDK